MRSVAVIRTLAAHLLVCLGTGLTPAQEGPKLAIHLGPPMGKNPCTLPSTPCVQYQSHGELLTEYAAYIIATQVPEEGLSGVEFGVRYDSPLSIYATQSCADYIFPNLDWPASRGRLAVNWMIDTNCQDDAGPNPEDGRVSVVTVLSMYAYGDARFEFFPDPGLPAAQWTDCLGATSPFDIMQASVLGFGEEPDCNACVQDCEHEPRAYVESPAYFQEHITHVDAKGINVKNIGQVPFTVDPTDTSGCCQDFTIRNANDSFNAFTLAPQQETQLHVRYHPHDFGRDTCHVAVGPETLTVIGNGLYGCYTGSTNVGFARTRVGAQRVISVNYTTYGPPPLADNTDCHDFGVGWELIQTPGPILILVQIAFSPSVAGEQTCEVNLSEHCPTITATATAYGHLGFPETLDFGDELQPGQAYTLPIIIENRGAPITFSPSSPCSVFSVSPQGPISLAEGEQQELLVTIESDYLEEYTCTIELGDYEGASFVATGIYTDVVPVDLFSLKATRVPGGAIISWKTTDAFDRSAFRVFRETASGERAPVHPDPLQGRTAYEVLDPAPPLGSARYWLQELESTGAVVWHGPILLEGITGFRVMGVAPNPFSHHTAIRFTSPQGRVQVSVFDVAGREVWFAQERFGSAGEHALVWDGRTSSGASAPTGIYFYNLIHDGRALHGKLIRIRD